MLNPVLLLEVQACDAGFEAGSAMDLAIQKAASGNSAVTQQSNLWTCHITSDSHVLSLSKDAPFWYLQAQQT